MDFETSWRALFKPGEATTFFSPAPQEPLDLSGSYSGSTAWWLAELSRLAYRRRGRDERLAAAGLRELEPFHCRGIQATLVAAAGAGGSRAHVLVFRGTDSPRDWLWNLNVSRDRAQSGGEVHRGFNRALDQIWGPVETALAGISAPVAYAGHSLGGALAVLAAARRAPETVYTFGAPRVGDQEFVDALGDVPIFQVVNNDDLVARLPPTLAGPPLRHAGTHYRILSRSRAAPRPRPEGWRELPTPFDSRRRLLGPPRSFNDHTPVNYVAHLERLALAAGRRDRTRSG